MGLAGGMSSLTSTNRTFSWLSPHLQPTSSGHLRRLRGSRESLKESSQRLRCMTSVRTSHGIGHCRIYLLNEQCKVFVRLQRPTRILWGCLREDVNTGSQSLSFDRRIRPIYASCLCFDCFRYRRLLHTLWLLPVLLPLLLLRVPQRAGWA
jgi:hypothetical protein